LKTAFVLNLEYLYRTNLKPLTVWIFAVAISPRCVLKTAFVLNLEYLYRANLKPLTVWIFAVAISPR